MDHLTPARPSSHGPDPLRTCPPSVPPLHHNQPTPALAHLRPLVSTLGWDLKSIVATSPNFHPVQRVHYTSPNAKVDIVIPEVEANGVPMIIAGWNRHPRWPRTLFSLDWLRKNGDQNPTVRNVHNWVDFKISMDDFLQRLHDSPAYATPDEQERLYGKDGDCPTEWTNWLTSGALPEELVFHGSNNFLNFLPDEAKVQTLMCYTGIGDTFTPFHKDLCASTGQNLMCFSEHSGSSFWFMTKTSAAPKVAAYFHDLGQEVDLETHVVTIEELAKAPFDVYIAEQQLGDLVLVPPRCCHQVVNKGGITIKTSWSRMSLIGLQAALWHELPVYHRVCRQEIYKVKSNIFHALKHFARLVTDLSDHPESTSYPTSMENLKQLVCLFDDILASEFSISRDSMPHVSFSQSSHTDNLRCDFCGADIFQSFFECDSCLPLSASGGFADVLLVGDGLTLCPLCYVEGRTCQCGGMEPVQCRPFSELLEVRDQAVRTIQLIDRNYTNARGYLSEHPVKLLSGPDANIFEAACKLFQRQLMENKAMRSCRARQPHQVPISAAVTCKPCHFSKCYAHLLEIDYIHSVDAIMLSEDHDGDATWHQFHRNGSPQYRELQQRAIEDEEKGVRPNASHKLIYLAKNFTTCRAMEPEMTKHGWYDRFAQMTTIPIVNTPPKVLVGLPDEVHNGERYDGHTLDDISTGNLPSSMSQGGILQTTDPRPTLSSSGVADEDQISHQSSLSAASDFRSPALDSMTPSSELATLQLLSTPNGVNTETSQRTSVRPLSVTCSPPGTKQLAVASLLSTAGDDCLSDLTDLPSEIDSSPLSSFVALPVSEKLDDRPPTVSQVTLKPKAKLIFDCVEIPPPRWSNGRKIKFSSSTREKRKQSNIRLSSDIIGPTESDESLSAAEETSNRLERKRKLSQGPASRLSQSSKRMLGVQHAPSPNNHLANALNQTFQLNSTTAPSPVLNDTSSSVDVVPSVSDVIIKPPVKPQYRDIGVQKSTNFIRNTAPAQPSEDLSGCITKLQAEIRDLRGQAETLKHERDAYRDSMDELNKRYNTSGPPPTSSPQRPPSGGQSDLRLRPHPELSTHPRWRTRTIATENHPRLATDVSELDHPPIETLHLCTSSSGETVSTSPRRRTPTEPRSLRSRIDDGDFHGNRAQPYFRPQQHGRKRGPPEQTNGRRRRGRGRGPSSFGRSERPINNLTPSPPHSPAEGMFDTLARVDEAMDTQDYHHHHHHHHEDLDDGW